MLSGTEVLIGALFILALVAMSIIDVAFANVNKVTVRRLIDGPKAKAATSLAAMLETRTEVLTSVHVIIQLILVLGSVFVFTAFERLQLPYAASVTGSAAVMMIVILLFRHLIPRIVTIRSPEGVLLLLFPIFRITHFALRPLSLLLVAAFNYFHRWDQELEP